MVLKWLAGVKMIELKVQGIHAYPSSGKDALAERGISLVPRLLCSIVREPVNVECGFYSSIGSSSVYTGIMLGRALYKHTQRVIISGETSMVWEH